MPSITLNVPGDIRNLMKEYPEINWSGFVRVAIEEKIKKLSWKNKMLHQLEHDEIALELGRKVKQKSWEKLKKEGW